MKFHAIVEKLPEKSSAKSEPKRNIIAAETFEEKLWSVSTTFAKKFAMKVLVLHAKKKKQYFDTVKKKKLKFSEELMESHAIKFVERLLAVVTINATRPVT